MPALTIRTKFMPLGVTGAVALAIMAAAGLSQNVVARPAPDKTAAAAQAALSSGQVDKAIKLAEAVVAASPREPAYRALLAHAYLKSGRFDSAAQTFDEAMKLGDISGKTALGLSLALAAAGRNGEAVGILDDWRDAIPLADLGLALALAGEPTRGSAVLADGLRNGENSPKLRQNLAYAYALDGRWREARLMMSQDVPADQIDARISQWAAQSRPEESKQRVASLLNVPMRSDPGRPAQLALATNPETEQLAVESTAVASGPKVATAAPAGELPPVAASEPVSTMASYTPVTAPVRQPAASRFDTAFAAPGSVSTVARTANGAAVTFVSQPVVQPLPVRQAGASQTVASRLPRETAARRIAAAVPVPTKAAGTHLIQLGSYFTPQGARRAWGIYSAKNPELRNYRMTITQASVRGRTYFRVAAAGIIGSHGASSLCGAVKARGMACFAYAAHAALPGMKASAATQFAKAKVPTAAPKTASVAPILARKR